MSWCLASFLFGTALLSVASGLSPWNYNFASCSDGKIEGNCTCPKGKVMARISNRLLCFERIDSCPNGYIGLLGTCNCFAGEDSDGSCLKICSNCDNGWCSSSEKCECNQGFRMSKDNKCEPICENICPENGICSAPGVCSCKEGYRRSENEEKCEPICSEECPENAYCSAPDQCICNKGYLRSGTNFCIPDCEDKCAYGICVSPGNCICKRGSRKNRNNECSKSIFLKDSYPLPHRPRYGSVGFGFDDDYYNEDYHDDYYV